MTSTGLTPAQLAQLHNRGNDGKWQAKTHAAVDTAEDPLGVESGQERLEYCGPELPSWDDHEAIIDYMPKPNEPGYGEGLRKLDLHGRVKGRHIGPSVDDMHASGILVTDSKDGGDPEARFRLNPVHFKTPAQRETDEAAAHARTADEVSARLHSQLATAGYDVDSIDLREGRTHIEADGAAGRLDLDVFLESNRRGNWAEITGTITTPNAEIPLHSGREGPMGSQLRMHNSDAAAAQRNYQGDRRAAAEAHMELARELSCSTSTGDDSARRGAAHRLARERGEAVEYDIAEAPGDGVGRGCAFPDGSTLEVQAAGDDQGHITGEAVHTRSDGQAARATFSQDFDDLAEDIGTEACLGDAVVEWTEHSTDLTDELREVDQRSRRARTAQDYRAHFTRLRDAGGF